MQRFSVVGSTGSGKTTVARSIGERLGIPVVEMDAIHWGPDWTPQPTGQIRGKVAEAVAGDSWVVDGNYRSISQELVWSRADTVVWLDMSFWTNARQLLRRTYLRVVRREELWNGNRESLRAAFGRDSILWWLVKTHRANRRRYEEDMTSGEWPHLEFIQLRSRREVGSWLERLAAP